MLNGIRFFLDQCCFLLLCRHGFLRTILFRPRISVTCLMHRIPCWWCLSTVGGMLRKREVTPPEN